MTFNAAEFLAGLFDETEHPAGDAHAAVDPRFPPDPLAAMAPASMRSVDPAGDGDHDHDLRNVAGQRWDDLPNAAEVPGCPTCLRLMTWQDGGGQWRCGTCDPPTRSRRLADRADRLRHLAAAADGSRSHLRLSTTVPDGNSHISRQSLGTAPDRRIIADPVTMCLRCGTARVLPELRTMTGGVCWSCYLAAAPRGRGDILPARRSSTIPAPPVHTGEIGNFRG